MTRARLCTGLWRRDQSLAFRIQRSAMIPVRFVVQGEQHYWVHVAIDRFTGQVIDKQIEVVNE